MNREQNSCHSNDNSSHDNATCNDKTGCHLLLLLNIIIVVVIDILMASVLNTQTLNPKP